MSDPKKILRRALKGARTARKVARAIYSFLRNDVNYKAIAKAMMPTRESFQIDPAQVRIFFRTGDFLREGLQLTAAVALAVAAAYWVGTKFFIEGSTFSYVLTRGVGFLADNAFPTLFKKLRIKEKDNKSLRKAMLILTMKARLKRKPTLYNFEIDPKAVERKSDSSTPLPQMQRVANAAAAGLNKPVVAISNRS